MSKLRAVWTFNLCVCFVLPVLKIILFVINEILAFKAANGKYFTIRNWSITVTAYSSTKYETSVWKCSERKQWFKGFN